MTKILGDLIPRSNDKRNIKAPVIFIIVHVCSSFLYLSPLLFNCDSLLPFVGFTASPPPIRSVVFQFVADKILNWGCSKCFFVLMGGGSLKKYEVECCPLCDQGSHSVESCPWVYSKCRKPNWRCFGCAGTEHWWNHCPWRSVICEKKGCGSPMKLCTSRTQSSKGKKFLKYQNILCGKFIWLKDAIEAAANNNAGTKDKVHMKVKINVTMDLNEFCREFKGKSSLG
ncbi:hypothetical protein GIB67_000519 [Kingdonia uniflora]|uniref:Uncharacterized protein n=1 Tax=Kingdonia uniflora TaxID=39325 RepID=A0A7J7MI86_9MAGN|nr:hypothetical protein GIB67_000519 [Kingdonia uniflora]